MLIDPDNFIPANPLVTPPHIQPEWYFLFAYAILRTIPNKLGGVIALIISIIILAFLPVTSNYKSKIKNNLIKKLNWKIIFFFWIINFFYLTIIGAIPIEYPFTETAKISRILYFTFYIFYF